jgi:hypothetical protein
MNFVTSHLTYVEWLIKQPVEESRTKKLCPRLLSVVFQQQKFLNNMAWVGSAESFTFVFSRAVRRQNENLSSTISIAGTESQINLNSVS